MHLIKLLAMNTRKTFSRSLARQKFFFELIFTDLLLIPFKIPKKSRLKLTFLDPKEFHHLMLISDFFPVLLIPIPPPPPPSSPPPPSVPEMKTKADFID
jgi:hypothetical protein